MNALQSYTGWFLTVMLDQLRFSLAVLDLDALRPRYLSLVRDLSADDKRAQKLVDHVLRYGEMARGDAAMVLQVSPRTAQTVVRAAQMSGFITSDGPKTPVRIAFPLDYRERLFPNLFSAEPLDVPVPPELPRG